MKVGSEINFIKESVCVEERENWTITTEEEVLQEEAQS